MRSIGAGAAGGIGEAIANHIIEGRPPFDMYNLVSTYLIKKKRAAVNHYLHHTESHVNVSFHWFLANPIAHA